MRLRFRLAAVVLAIAGASTAPAQRFDSIAVRAVVPGVTHRRLVDNAGPWIVNVVTVDLRQPGIAVGSLRADDAYAGRERVSEMVRRRAGADGRIVAAINGDLFDLRTGATESNAVVGGTIVKAGPFTDSEQAAFRSAHAQFAVTERGRPLIDRFAFDGRLAGAFLDVAIRGVNERPAGEPNAVVLYDRWIGDRTPVDSAATEREPLAQVALRTRRAHGDTVWLRADTAVAGSGTALPRGGYVLAGYGASAALVARLRGRDVRAVLSFHPDRGPIRTLVGGWGRLLEDGRLVADSVDRREGTPPAFSVTRHPRTGVGFSRDSSTLYLVTVDGRSESSNGMSLEEFARLFQQLGAYQAVNLDGGGSTTMVIRDSVVNRPSDPEGERTVGNAVVVTVRSGKFESKRVRGYEGRG